MLRGAAFCLAALLALPLVHGNTEQTIVGPLSVTFPYWPGQVGLAQGRTIRVVGTRYAAPTANLRQRATLSNPAGKRLFITSARGAACDSPNSTAAESPSDGKISVTTSSSTFALDFPAVYQAATADSSGKASVCLRVQCVEVQGDCGTQVALAAYSGLLVTVSGGGSSSASSTQGSSLIATIVSVLILCAIIAAVAFLCRRCQQQRLAQQQQQQQHYATGGDYPVAVPVASSYPYPMPGQYPGVPQQYPGAPQQYPPAAPYANAGYPGYPGQMPPKVVYMQQQQQPMYGGQGYNQGGMSTGAAVGAGVLGGVMLGHMMDGGGFNRPSA